ncbi:hypothetical protein J6590_071942 [Homalodisca vitripennis]|nr:hypothetical protein J6590_071942 [Homalodisca vitripennis]
MTNVTTAGNLGYNTGHRTATFKRLPSDVGVKLINKFPDEIKNLNDPTKFKARLRHFLVSRVFYLRRVYNEPLG